MIAIDKGIISRWKIDSPFENWLGRMADDNILFMRLYCLYYYLFDRKYYKTGIEMARKVIMSRTCVCGGGDSISTVYDMIYSLHRFGFAFDEYFIYELQNKKAAARDAYISDKMRYEYYCIMNSEEGIKLLRDKGKTFEVFSEYFKRKCLAVYSNENKRDFLEFIAQVSKFIKKPIGLDCGRGVSIINVEKSNAECMFDSLLKDGPFIVEELIKQSEEMAKFHRESINTVRVPTITCKDGVHIFLPFFRMGRGHSIVDNAGAGGIFASVDSESGIIYSKGCAENDATQYIRHPDSGEIIVGHQLPDWEDAVSLVTKLATILPNVRYVGWDLAHTDGGWVLVEGNGSGQFVSQMADKIGRKQEILKLMDNLL